MARTLPASAPNLALRVDDRVTLEYDLTVVTPMVGGSAIAKEATTQIRPTEIMGNLRHWWRATNAGCFDLTELVRQENDLFGSAVHPGNCQISVTTVKPGSVRTDIKNNSSMVYALWPLRNSKDDTSSRTELTNQVTLGTQFKLRLSFKQELEQTILPAIVLAMQAFITYGGLGGRTRRGCGSLQLTQLTTQRPGKELRVDNYTQPIRKIGLPTAPAKRVNLMTGLPQHVFILGQAMRDAVQAWQKSLDAYQQFRQGTGRGRSPYPEADSVRHLVKHSRTPEVYGFPRADLGLPIVMQFINEPDLADVTIQGANEGQHRFASPIITKALQWDNGFIPMVAVLDAPHAWDKDVELTWKNNVKPTCRDDIMLTEQDRKTIEPLNGDPIRVAFEKYLKREGWREVETKVQA